MSPVVETDRKRVQISGLLTERVFRAHHRTGEISRLLPNLAAVKGSVDGTPSPPHAMTITPLPRVDGALHQFEPPPIPDHVAGGNESDFIAFALEWRKRHLAGKETQNDHQLVEAWLTDCTPTQSVETVKTYKRHIERLRAFLRQWHEAPLKEQRDERFLAPGNPEAIETFARQLKHLTSTLDDNDRPLMAASTYNVIVAAVSSFYRWASQPNRRAHTGVPLSPVPSGLQLKKAPRRAKALSHEHLHAVIHGAKQCRTSASGQRDALVIKLVYLLGTRATETVNLRWSDVVQLETGPSVHVRAECASNHISRQGLWKLCNRAGEKAGVKFWPHCGRHTHATHAYAVTRDPKLIQATLGHADIGTTMQLYVDESNGDSSAKHLLVD
jgi:integrase